jgi:hypothetical protein
VDNLCRVRRKIRSGELANQNHRMRRGDGAMSGSTGGSPFHGTGDEDWVRRERKEKMWHF